MRASATPKADAVGTAILAGLLAGIVMGGVVHAGSTVLSTIGAIVGPSAAIAGWIVHLLLSIGFALGFVLLLATTPADAAFREPVDTALLGVAYGGLLAIVTWGVVIPLSLTSGGSFPLDLTPSATALARLAVVLGVAHLAYGVVLGSIVANRYQPGAIRADRPHNEAVYGAESTMTGILGRMAAYSGKMLTWDEALASGRKLTADGETWDSPAPVQPLASGGYEIPVPGFTQVLE